MWLPNLFINLVPDRAHRGHRQDALHQMRDFPDHVILFIEDWLSDLHQD